MAVKNWSDGDYVYGTNFDEIVSSTVMRFPDAATRTSTLVGDLAPQPGMMTFLASTRRCEQYIVISGTGYWTPLPGTLVAVLRQLTNQPVPNNSDVVLNLDIEDLDILNGHAAGASRYTCIIPGWYEFAGGTTFSGNAVGQRMAKWKKNGVIQPSSSATTGAADTTPFNVAARSLPLSLVAGDYVELIAYQTSGIAGGLDSVAGSSATSFSAIMTAKYLGAP